jgi:prephenate dehydrogenase
MKNSSRTHSDFRRIAIIGVGVIGGSLGLAIKNRFRNVRVVGVDRRDILRKALKKGAIDESSTDLRAAVSGSDLVLLATPVSVILKDLPKVAKFSSTRTIVTDVGSVKRDIVRAGIRLFPEGNFIGGHPMAGVELSGVEAAHPLLFENALYVLTPSKKTPPATLRRLADFLKDLGARVVLLDAKTHDEVASAVSHLPQLTAVALTNVAGREHPSGRRHLSLAAGGFRDLTRIASSRPEIWKDILSMNSDQIVKSLGLLIRELGKYRSLLGQHGPELAQRFRSARRIRNNIPRSMKGFIHPLAELYVFVQDRPGMMARMTSALAKARINIKDIELVKIREGRGGTFRLAFESREVSGRATQILKRAGFEIGE